MEETMEIIKNTLKSEAAMRDELKVTLRNMSERQDAFARLGAATRLRRSRVRSRGGISPRREMRRDRERSRVSPLCRLF